MFNPFIIWNYIRMLSLMTIQYLLQKQPEQKNDVQLENDATIGYVEKSIPEEAAKELPVRCGKKDGILHIVRFGSGRNGKCIEHKGEWYTPYEFEIFAGLGLSKCWRKSIKYGVRCDLMMLIKKKRIKTALCTTLPLLGVHR